MSRPAIRYAVARDGVRIAYWSLGGGRPLVHLPGIPYTHVGREWDIAEYRNWFERLARRHLLVRYDSRGLGLSACALDDCSLDALVLDLAAVVDALGPEPVALYARVHATPVALAYAARVPERVSELVLMRPYARGIDHARSESAARIRSRLDSSWNAFVEELARQGPRWSDEATQVKFADFVRASLDRETFLAYERAIREADVTSELPDVQARTLLIYRESRAADLGNAQALAELIPGAQLEILAGHGSRGFLRDASELAQLVDSFLAADGGDVSPGAGSRGGESPEVNEKRTRRLA